MYIPCFSDVFSPVLFGPFGPNFTDEKCKFLCYAAEEVNVTQAYVGGSQNAVKNATVFFRKLLL